LQFSCSERFNVAGSLSAGKAAGKLGRLDLHYELNSAAAFMATLTASSGQQKSPPRWAAGFMSIPVA
jgi:hypothetical protein